MLHLVCKYPDNSNFGTLIQIFDLLLFHGLDINLKDSDGYTPFNTACRAILGSYDFLHYLILKGSNINIKGDDNIVPINNIINMDIKVKIVKFILENKK